jgi:hypothetical protein
MWQLQQVDASELLSIFPALRAFIDEAFGKSAPLHAEVTSFLKLSRVCDLVKQCLTECTYDPDKMAASLEVAVEAYLVAFKAAYGEEHVRFKHHQLLHLAGQIKKDRMLLACWAAERKNKHLLQCCFHQKHAPAMTPGVLGKAVAGQVAFPSTFIRIRFAVSTAACQGRIPIKTHLHSFAVSTAACQGPTCKHVCGLA